MSRGWKVTTLGDICVVQSGAGFPTRFQGKVDGPIPFFKVSDMNLEGNETSLVTANNYITEEVRSALGAQIFPEGSVVFPKVGGAIATNKKRQVVRPSCVDNNVMGLVPDATVVDCNYLHHWILGQDIYEFSNKANPPSITQSTVKAWPFLLPPLDEQKRIVAVLDQAFAALDRARANAETNLADAQALFKAELQLQFETAGARSDLVSFDAVCQPLTPRVKLKRQDYLDAGEYPVVSQEADLVSGYWDDPAALMGINDPVVVFGDHTCCLKFVNFDFVVGADGTKVLLPAEGISAKYLYYGLRSQPIQQSGYARHFKLLRETTLPGLPTAEQNRITDHLDQLEERCRDLRNSYERQLTDLTTLRQSLLQAAFSGHLS